MYRWIDKQNQKVCKRITLKYFLGNCGHIAYALDKSFYILYLRRLLLILLSLLSFKVSIFKTFGRILSRRSFSLSASYDRSVKYTIFKEFLWNLFGHAYFAPEELQPMLSEKQIMSHRLTFKEFEYPLISIIIPLYNQLPYTFNCLLSLTRYLSLNTPYEIIIINDCSTDNTSAFMTSNITGITYIENEQNLGFLDSCNKAASAARGQYICFLNNDTQIHPGWLDNLIATIAQDETVGCVGSKLIFPNGLLQEAGGIIFNDGSSGRYGSLQNVAFLEFNIAKEVDYCSGASLLIRKSDFDKIGGFDQRYKPAYYEDTDLCMACKYLLNKKVIYQPLSVLIHFERISSTGGQINTNLENNKKIFRQKWKKELMKHEINAGLK